MAEEAPARAPVTPERFKEASDWFRAKKAVTRDEWKAMSIAARQQSFTVAGVQQLEVVQTVMESMQRAIDSGEGIDKWRAEIKDKLGKQFLDEHATTLTTSFVTTNQFAYNTGRYYQLTHPDVTAALPYLKLDVVLDDRTTKNVCRPIAGTILPANDPWWQTHWPPLHPRCRSTVRAISERMAKRHGGVTENPERPKISGDFGLAPPLRATWEPDLNKYDPNAASVYSQKQRSMRERQAAGERAPRKRTVTPSERLGEVGEKVFGRKISDSELDRLFGANAKLPSGMALSITRVKEFDDDNTVSVIGAIRNEKGHIIASISREFARGADGKTIAKHASFMVSDEYQGKGLGGAVFNAQIDAYKKTGLVKRVELDAATAGRYVWTKAGFEWGTDDQAKLFDHLRTRLNDSVGAEATDKIMSKVKSPYDVSRLVVDGQRVGKDLLMEYPEDIVSMSQTPKKIKRL